jgi:hypothetical protein
MVNEWFVVRDGLMGAARVPSLARTATRVSAAELLTLLLCGATAALAVGYVKPSLGIPGHAIVLAALPMALGMALAPRRLAGCTMSAGALGSAFALTALGARYGSGALVSLTLLGPMMDLALRRVQRGWRVYAALVTAGVGANVLALGSRATTKLLGLDLAGGRPFDSWWLQAIVTYTLSGAVAGLLGALCWFHLNDRTRGGSEA